MSTDHRLADAVCTFESLLNNGEQVSIEDVCQWLKCPELADQVRQKIQLLRGIDWEESLKNTRRGRLSVRPPSVRGYEFGPLLGQGGFGEVWEVVREGG